MLLRLQQYLNLIPPPSVTPRQGVKSECMTEYLLNQAKVWGFPCEKKDEDNWCISPQQTAERWQLCQAGERWVLMVNGVAQISLSPEEVLVFLKRSRA